MGNLCVEFNAILLKVASRCNIDCDYCYVYHHQDASWREQPKTMATQTVAAVASRLREYITARDLRQFSVTFHGGEPLLLPFEQLAAFADMIRAAAPTCDFEFSLQTNGTLLTPEMLKGLVAARISISMSLDGPREVHDLHRLDHRHHSTFDATLRALTLLREHGGEWFRGVIAVIDPRTDPRRILRFFADLRVPTLDFLLPDATHASPAPHGERDGYRRWLHDAFDAWYADFPELRIRWFDAVLASRFGVPSPTDVMGFGAVNLLVIDTDGGYTDHDVFKIVGDGAPGLGSSVFKTAIRDLHDHPKLLAHAKALTFDGIAAECQVCPAVEACGGGSVMHRFHPLRGLNAPSAYCAELYEVLRHASHLIQTSCEDPENLATEAVPPAGLFKIDSELVKLCLQWRQWTEQEADRICQELAINRNGRSAGSVFLLRADSSLLGRHRNSLCGSGRDWRGIRIHANDRVLLEAFQKDIVALDPEDALASRWDEMLASAMKRLSEFSADLPRAIAALISDIIMVKSTGDVAASIFSFSDDQAPNVLYIAPRAGDESLSSDDLADSIFHEFLHQVLYQYDRDKRLLFDYEFPRFPAPWRKGLRPSGGFLHGTYVFGMLSLYWHALGEHATGGLRDKARSNAASFRRNAFYGLGSLRDLAILTRRGTAFLEELARRLGVPLDRIPSPRPSIAGTSPK